MLAQKVVFIVESNLRNWAAIERWSGWWCCWWYLMCVIWNSRCQQLVICAITERKSKRLIWWSLKIYKQIWTRGCLGSELKTRDRPCIWESWSRLRLKGWRYRGGSALQTYWIIAPKWLDVVILYRYFFGSVSFRSLPFFYWFFLSNVSSNIFWGYCS